MDRKQLSRSIETLDRRTRRDAKNEEKKEARLTKQNVRKQERTAPYLELNQRNLAIFDRAAALAKIFPAVSKPTKDPHATTTHRVNVLIGEADRTSTTPDHMVLAQVATHEWKFNGHPRKQAILSFYSIERKEAERLQKESYSSPLMTMDSNGRKLTEQSSFITSYDSKLFMDISETVSGHAFSPIRAIRRASHVKELDQQLTDIEDTMDMIDAAAHDPELNPALSLLLQENSTRNLEATA